MSRAATMALVTIDEAERERRRGAVDAARASTALEGRTASDEAHADQEAYVRGDIEVDELLERVGRFR